MKKITIFIGSSINECRNERLELTNFIRSVSDELEERYEVKLVPVVCEEIDPCMRSARKQEEYNELIRKSDMSFFIFFTKAGKYTIEEFETAYEQMKKSETSDKEGRPKVYVYRKNLPEGVAADKSLIPFLKRVDKQYGHYYGAFDHVDTVKLRVLLNVKMQEMQFLKIDVSEGKCRVDGKEVLDLKKVAEFANSGELRRLRAELEQTEEKYFRMKPEYAAGKSDAAFYREYAAVAAHRQELLETIEALEKSIFELSLHLSEDEVRGKITQRMKEAYRKLEAGDIEGCLAIVNPDEIIDEFTRWEKKHIEEAKRRAYYCIREVQIYINALKTAYSYPDRFAEIRKSYEKILPIAKNYGMEEEILYDYAAFLYEQRDFDNALKHAEELCFIYDGTEIADRYRKAQLYNLLSAIYSDMRRYDEAEKYGLIGLNIRKRLAAENPIAYENDVAMSCNNLAVVYCDIGKFDLAEHYHLSALKIRIRLADKNPQEYEAALAISYNNLAVLYFTLERYKEAEDYSLCALEIRKRLVKTYPQIYQTDLAVSYINLAVLYRAMGRYSEAQKYCNQAIEVREILVQVNPMGNEPGLADGYQTLASLYSDVGRYQEAEECFWRTLDLRIKLAKINTKRFEADLAGSYNSFAEFYRKYGQDENAEECYYNSLEIYKQLYSENELSYGSDLAMIYNNLSVLYQEIGQYEDSERSILNAMQIYKRLADDHSVSHLSDLAMGFNNLAILYCKMGLYNQAENCFFCAKNIYLSLAEDNYLFVAADLAMTYNNFAVLYSNGGFFEKAQECYLQAFKIWNELSKNMPCLYEVKLAVSYLSYAALCEKMKQDEEAKEYKQKAYLFSKKYKDVDANCERIYENLKGLFPDSEAGE